MKKISKLLVLLTIVILSFILNAANAAGLHRYAAARQIVDNKGGDSRLSVWKPNGYFSLSQHWYASGSGASTQTVEGGWKVFNPRGGSSDPELFIYYTPDNYATGCYNLDCAAFVQVNNSWVLGGRVAPQSTIDGTQYIIRMQWQLFEGNWWLFLQGTGAYVPVGYYPGSLYGERGQMTRHAERITYGGETVGDASDVAGKMGSGRMANEGWRKAAYQRTIYYIDTSLNSHWANLTEIEPTPACYTIDINNNSGNAWGTYIYFGGPRCPNP